MLNVILPVGFTKKYCDYRCRINDDDIYIYIYICYICLQMLSRISRIRMRVQVFVVDPIIKSTGNICYIRISHVLYIIIARQEYCCGSGVV